MTGPSSTSSSEGRIPDLPFARLCAFTTAVFLVLLGAAEGAFRGAGHRPSVADTPTLWAIRRSEVYAADGRRSLVIVGSSRSQLGIVPGAIEEAVPGVRVTHLAIDGRPSWVVLDDLCRDPRFDGIILWDTFGLGLGPGEKGRHGRQREFLDAFHAGNRFGGGIDRDLNGRASSLLQGSLSVLSPLMDGRRRVLLWSLLSRPTYHAMDGRRHRSAGYMDRMTPVELRQHREERTRRRAMDRTRLDPREYPGLLSEFLTPLRDSLVSRGGALVLLRMPTTGDHLGMDDEDAPRREFWDRIEPLTGIPAIHFQDDPGLAGFDCPDGSHLDARDAPVFSRRLAEVLKERLPADVLPR